MKSSDLQAGLNGVDFEVHVDFAFSIITTRGIKYHRI